MAKKEDIKPSMTWTKLFFFMFTMIAMAIAISIFGPMSSRYVDKKERTKIDQHGKMVNGVVTGKRQSRGRGIYFIYTYKGISYLGEQSYGNYKRNDYKYYDSFEKDDSVGVMLDSLSPGNCYLIR